MTARGRNGFTLIELVVVLAVLAILVGTATPMARLFIDQSRRDDVMSELREVSAALEEYYFDKGTFPASLTAVDFLGVYLVPGVSQTVVNDSWGGNVGYVFAVVADPDLATIRSRGPNGQDDLGAADDIQSLVPGSVPGSRKTRARMRLIVEVLANFIESGGVLTGTWSTDRAAMGLGLDFRDDGFGTAFTLDPATYVLRSAGADRAFATGDDLTS